jgi:hypothetical protein
MYKRFILNKTNKNAALEKRRIFERLRLSAAFWGAPKGLPASRISSF